MKSMYPDMAAILEDRESGSARIKHYEVTKNDIRAIVREGIPVGTYVKLEVDGELMMSNTPMEMRTNMEFVEEAHGDVLIGGLGLGMILLAIQDKPEVTSIMVLEKSGDVIDIVASQLPLNEKVTVIEADVWDWEVPRGVEYDCIYMDIWPFINSDIYEEEMMPLMEKFEEHLKPYVLGSKRFCRCWAEDEAAADVELV